MMTATTKTFNIAGAHIGNVIIADAALRAPLRRAHDGAGHFAEQLSECIWRPPPIRPKVRPGSTR